LNSSTDVGVHSGRREESSGRETIFLAMSRRRFSTHTQNFLVEKRHTLGSFNSQSGKKSGRCILSCFFLFFFSRLLSISIHRSVLTLNDDIRRNLLWTKTDRLSLSEPRWLVSSYPQWLWLYYYYYSLLYVIARQTLSINGSVAVSVLDLSLDKTEMNSRITCRAVNPYLDSTVMEDTWNVNLSCKSICVSFSLIFIYLFHFFCPGLCNAHPSASLEDNPIVAQVLWFVARQPMIFSFLWIYWVWLLILHFYYSNDRSTIVAIVVRVVLALFAAGYPEFTSFIGWETRCFFFSRLLFASTSRPTCLM
jgi:hypothetical protein